MTIIAIVGAESTGKTVLAAALAGAAPEPGPGRELAFSHSWDDVAVSHEALYLSHFGGS